MRVYASSCSLPLQNLSWAWGECGKQSLELGKRDVLGRATRLPNSNLRELGHKTVKKKTRQELKLKIWRNFLSLPKDN